MLILHRVRLGSKCFNILQSPVANPEALNAIIFNCLSGLYFKPSLIFCLVIESLKFAEPRLSKSAKAIN